MTRRRGHVCIVTAALFLAAVVSTAAAVTRTWTDSTGRHRVEAEFVKLEDGQLTLRKADGEEVTLPLERLSAKDRAVAERLAAVDEDVNPRRDMRADRQAIEEAAVRFFETLQTTDRAGLGELLTAAARARHVAGESPVKDLPAPDRGRIRAAGVNVEGDSATAEVPVRLRGQYQRTTLHLRREAEEWRIHSISAPGPGGDLVTIHFEGEGGAVAGVPSDTQVASDAVTDPNGGAAGPITVPDGNARELSAFIEGVLKTKVQGSQRDAQDQYKRIFTAVAEASDKILAGEATLAQKRDALNHKLTAISNLSLLNVPGAKEQLAAVPDQLDQLGLDELKPMIQSALLTSQLQNYQSLSRAEAKALVEQAAQHLQTAEIGLSEATLARLAAQIAEMIDTEFAAGINMELGSLLAASRERAFQSVGESMLATARRLGLVGNRMELTGVMLDGTSFNLSQYEGKVVLVDFWATWCGPCMEEMPNIRRNYEEYHSKGFEVVAVSLDQDLQALRQYVQSETPPWTILAEYHPKVPADQRPSDYYGINAIPTTILVGPDGNVISLSCRGEQLGSHLRRLLGPAS